MGICGAYDGLAGHIREFLSHIPVIERCNTVLWSNTSSVDIHNVSRPASRFAGYLTRVELMMMDKILVACYSTLLSFYSKVMAFLQEESRIKRLLETFHSEIPGIVTSFNGHADRLSNMMEVETLVTVRKILDQQTEEFGTCNTCRRSHWKLSQKKCSQINVPIAHVDL